MTTTENALHVFDGSICPRCDRPHQPLESRTALVDELAAEVLRLRAELDDMRRILAAEVRTRRVVVVDDQGRERIVAGQGTAFGTAVVVSSETGRVEAFIYASEDEAPGVGEADAGYGVSTDDEIAIHLYSTAQPDRSAISQLDLEAKNGDSSAPQSNVYLRAREGGAEVVVASGPKLRPGPDHQAQVFIHAQHDESEMPTATVLVLCGDDEQELRVQGAQPIT